MKKVTLGGDRLGSGKRMKIELKNYERSTHDLSTIRRTSAAPGTLIPIYSKPALPGDTWDIELEVDIMTHPTLGPLFGSYKVQIDVFQIPIRLYNSWLHNNKLGIGMNMAQVLLPQIKVSAIAEDNPAQNSQINTSSILKYLGISGIGTAGSGVTVGSPYYRLFNGIPFLAYWDIYKNYYANKQETNGYVIHTESYTEPDSAVITGTTHGTGETLGFQVTVDAIVLKQGDRITFTYPDDATAQAQLQYIPGYTINVDGIGIVPLTQIFKNIIQVNGNKIQIYNTDTDYADKTLEWYDINVVSNIKLTPFPITNIDVARELILHTSGNTQFTVSAANVAPYGLPFKLYTENGVQKYSCQNSQEGLAVKTYQSDVLNNWIKTETQDYISDISAISTSGGSFTIDQLNLSQKVYNMLNRIAASGGTYQDWIETVWMNDTLKHPETPVYMGGLIKELAFQQITSTATTDTSSGGTQPLGQLAGKGVLTNKHKGGSIQIKVAEPSYIMVIFSLTPRVDYSQGNEWDMNLKTMDDFHKPELDEIGFQDLITEQMSWVGSDTDNAGVVTHQSAGKQPAWINYMTDVNKTFGSFAEPLNEMFMTLNRQYEENAAGNGIQDITTYIDPAKYNNIFAETKLDSQNFWVQVGINAEVRRKMSAKIIPNL